LSVLDLIHRRLPGLSPAEAQVGRAVLADLEGVPFASLQALAHRSGTSDATVMRFCTSLGFSGFQEFKTTLTAELIDRGSPRLPTERDTDRYVERLADDLRRTIAAVSPDVLTAVADRIASSRMTVVVGLAGSGAVAEVFASGLLGLNVPATRASDRVAIERWSAILDERDVLVGISHSGGAAEVQSAVARARARGAFTVVITNADRSPFGAAGDAAFVTSVTDTLLGSNACHPRIAELALLELVLNAVAERRTRAAAA
jgi:DNA-binding MurR/RpiR family transcriptional regulator